jgi:hypothetical protein
LAHAGDEAAPAVVEAPPEAIAVDGLALAREVEAAAAAARGREAREHPTAPPADALAKLPPNLAAAARKFIITTANRKKHREAIEEALARQAAVAKSKVASDGVSVIPPAGKSGRSSKRKSESADVVSTSVEDPAAVPTATQPTITAKAPTAARPSKSKSRPASTHTSGEVGSSATLTTSAGTDAGAAVGSTPAPSAPQPQLSRAEVLAAAVAARRAALVAEQARAVALELPSDHHRPVDCKPCGGDDDIVDDDAIEVVPLATDKAAASSVRHVPHHTSGQSEVVAERSAARKSAKMSKVR